MIARVFLAGLTGIFAAPAVGQAGERVALPERPAFERIDASDLNLIDANGNAVMPRPTPSAADLAPKYLDRGFA